MISCQACGARSRTSEEVFCRACGSDLSGAQQPIPVTTRVGGRTWAVIAGPVAVAATGVAVVAAMAAGTLGVTLDPGAREPTIPTGSSSPIAYPSTSPTSVIRPEVSVLLSHLPAAIAESCVEDGGFEELTDGMRAAVVCEGAGSGDVDSLTYVLYDSDASMGAAYDYVVKGYTSGSLPKRPSCGDGPARGRWFQSSVEAGSFVCYQSDASGVRMWWTTDGTAILTRAADDDMTVSSIWEWFLATSTGPY